jgi:hypothetical protein
MRPPKRKVTKADVLAARGVIEEEDLDEELLEIVDEE